MWVTCRRAGTRTRAGVRRCWNEFRGRPDFAENGSFWESHIEYSKGAGVFRAKGQFREAEAAFTRAEGPCGRPGCVEGTPGRSRSNRPGAQLEAGLDTLMASARRQVKASQGRLAEAEADVRRALLSRLKAAGKYNSVTPQHITELAAVLQKQGRYAEAEKLTRTALEIRRALGLAEDSKAIANNLRKLAGNLNQQRRWQEAQKVYAELDNAVRGWDPKRRQAFELNSGRIYMLYGTGQVEAGIAAAQALVVREKARVGDKHFDTMVARGTLAIGLSRARRDAEAIREFKSAIPVLLADLREGDDDDEIHDSTGEPDAHHRRGLYGGARARPTRQRYRRRDLQPGRRHSRPLRTECVDGVERAHGGRRPGARRAGAQGAGPGEAVRGPARRPEQCARATA